MIGQKYINFLKAITKKVLKPLSTSIFTSPLAGEVCFQCERKPASIGKQGEGFSNLHKCFHPSPNFSDTHFSCRKIFLLSTSSIPSLLRLAKLAKKKSCRKGRGFLRLLAFKCLSVLFTFFIALSVFPMEYEDLNSVKTPAYRVGTSDDIEQKADFVKQLDTETTKEIDPFENIEKLTYADLSIKRISKEISQELDVEYDDMLQDLALLWQGAATKSDIIKFALYKLSNPDKDKPDEKSVKKVLQSIASMSTLVGAGIGNPILSSGSFIGGNVLGIMSQDDKTINYKYTKVNDADMIILVRKIDDLQQKAVNRYYDYMTAKKLFEMTTKMAKQRYQNYQLAQNGTKELILITDAYYREALDIQMKARSDFYSKRSSLEQLVGNETFTQFESNVNLRKE